MSDNKHYGQEENSGDLKHVDSEKNTENAKSNTVSDVLGSRMSDMLSAKASKTNTRKKLPVAVDIIIAILMVAIIIGLVVGSYFLFRYYTIDYDSVELEYTVITPYENDINLYRSILNKELYHDSENNTYFLGKVISVELSSDQKSVIILVEANVRHRASEGYSVGDCRIAVGQDHSFRSQIMSFDGTIVGLNERNSSGKGGKQ